MVIAKLFSVPRMSVNQSLMNLTLLPFASCNTFCLLAVSKLPPLRSRFARLPGTGYPDDTRYDMNAHAGWIWPVVQARRRRFGLSWAGCTKGPPEMRRRGLGTRRVRRGEGTGDRRQPRTVTAEITAKGGEMTDRPEDRPEERRRTGPLGDDAEATRPAAPGDAAGDEPTRQVPSEQPSDEGTGSSRETERIPQRPQGPPAGETEEKETRVIRTPPYQSQVGTAASTYPRGYFEAAEEREERHRDMYGGVDWLASFLGFVFALVAGTLFSLVAGLVLAPLGVSLDLEGGEIGAAVITGLVLVAILVFLTYFFGGYVAGRLARFDGGRNGAMLLLWALAVALLAALAGGVFSHFLPAGIFQGARPNRRGAWWGKGLDFVVARSINKK